MSININLSEKQRHYLCCMAALQFPGSVANYSTRHPIHFLQEKGDGYEPVAASEFDAEEVVMVEYGDDGYRTFDTVEELVADHLGLDCKDPESIEEYNQNAVEYGEPLFATYKQATEAGIPNVEDEIFDVEEYLEAYSIPSDRVSFYRYPDTWETKAISFTHKGAEELRRELDNHIFRPTRFYAATTCAGDFPALMGVLYQCAEKCLADFSKGVQWTVNKRMSPEDVTAYFRKHPNEEVCVAEYLFTLQVDRTLGDASYHNAVIRVLISGEMRHCNHTEYPTSQRKVVMDCGSAGCWTSEYPFECDALGNALDEDKNILALFNYIHFINT